MDKLLEIKNVSKHFGGGFLSRKPINVAVDDISFSINAENPTITAIAGESGSGKTTLARLMLGFADPTVGSVNYQGRDLREMSGEQKMQFRREVQPIFQDPFEVFNPFYRVDHVMEMPIKTYGLADSKEEANRMIVESLEMVGLRPTETLGRFPHQLSGGQRQRIMVARALMLRPKLIMADEPVSMVDASLRATILGSLKEFNEELGISIVYITHDLTTAYQICENIIILYKGRVAEAGPVDQVIKDPKHPYTQLLVSSIPLPNPDTPWGGGQRVITQAADSTAQGCLFASRCPAAMEKCRVQVPDRFLPDSDRTAACFLYEDNPAMSNPDIASLLSAQKDAEVGAGASSPVS